ncbi:MAG: hypothetical protein SF187_14320 [Deltaproteobacteria bacterium]|nr:hypothetical protein [Deltaproteobacteria bacterium]
MSGTWIPTLISFAPALTRARLQPDDWQAIEKAYHVASRAYHNLEHLCEFAQLFSDYPWQQTDVVFNAILFHDFVYKPFRKDNEVRSAEVAVQRLRGRFIQGELDLNRVKELIELTARHGSIRPDEVDAEAAQFLDADMAIMGASPERYRRYATAVAHEYGVLPGWLFQRKRAAFLAALDKRPRLFLTEAFHARFDESARSNIRWELQQLVRPQKRSS